MNAHDRDVANEFIAAIELETSIDALENCYRTANLVCVDNRVVDEINEAKRKRIEELKNGYGTIRCLACD